MGMQHNCGQVEPTIQRIQEVSPVIIIKKRDGTETSQESSSWTKA